LHGGPEVLDHLIRVQDVAPDLVAPAGLDVLAPDLAELRLLLLQGTLQQASAEYLLGNLPVLRLRALVLDRDDDAGRAVGQPDRRVRLLDVLAARARGPEVLDVDLVPVQLELRVVLALRQDLDERERRLPPLLGVVRRDADEAMDAAL